MELNHQALVTKILEELDSSGSIIGEVKQYAGNDEPNGWMKCNGRTLNILEYPGLYSVIGTTYGGDGVNTFKIPDYRNKMLVGIGDLYTLSSTGGSKDAIIPSHRHSVSALGLGSHTHGQKTLTGTISDRRFQGNVQALFGSGIVSDGRGASAWLDGALGTSKSNYDTLTINATHEHDSVSISVPAHNTEYTGDDVTNKNMPPYQGINFIIYTGIRT